MGAARAWYRSSAHPAAELTVHQHGPGVHLALGRGPLMGPNVAGWVCVNTYAETTSEIEIGVVATNTWHCIRGGAMGVRDAQEHEPEGSF